MRGTKNQGAVFFGKTNSRGFLLPSLQHVGGKLRIVVMHLVVKESVDLRDQAMLVGSLRCQLSITLLLLATSKFSMLRSLLESAR